ncbi:hypothetical protein GQ55_3G412000 [Panicum hallii var. hallii]|uniref:Uncharacterized protein n=1 Tax=Panicum hallii var. hallii TaxID=1504633 RepID=A0A2T7EH69_9POAL|nr:hypothetical protein GQ55_3G412000 [Panicum hallii var. hallii]
MSARKNNANIGIYNPFYTKGTDASTIPSIEKILSAEPTEEQPSTVPTMMVPTQFDEINLKQAQDTRDNSLFSYQNGDLLEEEEVTSKTTKLQDILQLLNQDIGLLVQHAEGIRGIFCHLKGQLPANAEAALLPAAFIEGHQFKVLQAKQRLSDPRRADLMKELEAVTLALAEEEMKLEKLPNAIKKMKVDMKTPIREAIRLHKLIKPILGSAEDDQREIDEGDQICLSAVDAIQSFLRLL